MSLFTKAKRWYDNVVSMDGQLTGKDRSERAVLFDIACICFIVTAIAFATSSARKSLVLNLMYGIVLTTCGFSFTVSLCRVRITKRMIKGYVLAGTVATMLMQQQSAARSGSPSWFFFVLVLDLSLVMRLGRPFATGLVALVSLWVTLLHMEIAVRFGLLDIPGTADTQMRQEGADKWCGCAEPPCPHSGFGTAIDCIRTLMLLVLDFLATRGFAEAAEREQVAMARTIDTVEAAAQLLAGYDVDTVAELLAAAEGRLPPAMHAALQRLEQNLRSYRPYLPAALFECVADEGCLPAARVSAPGLEGAEATVVFTDIRASTAVWEAAPEAMQKAINTHNVVVREAIALFGGYEVKTIGDAFMVAFEGPCAGVDFGLAVQEALLDAEWPVALFDVPICRRTGLWGGLTVRVGVNHGPVMTETSTLTGRVDYFGHMVNIASRLESTCVPGAVAVPSALWSEVSGACAPAVAGEEVAAELKGVSGMVPVRHVWPAALAARQQEPLPNNTAAGSVCTSRRSSSLISSGKPGSICTAPSTHNMPRLSRRDMFTMQEKHATVGVVSLNIVADSSSAERISDCLESVVPLLQQSRGTLVSLLGEHLFTGWNLVQPVPVHAENAVQFARRALRVPLCDRLTAGLASGTVYHGDVGARKQRFVTVAGPVVAACMRVWRTAFDAGRRFLYTPSDGAVLVSALQALLQVCSLTQQKAGSWSAPTTLYELRDEEHYQMAKVQVEEASVPVLE